MKHPELLSLHNVSDLRISPEIGRHASLVHTPCEAGNNYKTRLYVSDFTASYPVGMSSITSLAWVDGAALAIGCPSADNTQFALLSLKDDSEGAVWNIPFGAGTERWASRQLLISAHRPVAREKAQEDGPWTILDEPPIQENDEGCHAKIWRQLFLCSYGGQLIRISPEEMGVRIVSAHSNGLAYAGYIPGNHGRIVSEIRYWAGGNRLLRRNCDDIRHFILDNNYAFIYALDIERETNPAPAPIQVSLGTGKANPLCVSGVTAGSHIVPDIGLQGRILCVDGDTLYFAATKGSSSQVCKLSASGEPPCPILDSGSIEQLGARAGQIVLAGLRRGSCQEVYVLGDGERTISHLHDSDTLPPHSMVETSCHGIQGQALREEAEEKACPAVTFLHDDPQQVLGKVYHFGIQLLAQGGYVVLSTSLPGSMGYGKGFSVLDGYLGDGDCNDPIHFLDTVLDAYLEIDPSHLTVIGIDYEACLVATATGKYNRLRVTICDGVISNCVSMVSTSDHGVVFAERQMKVCTFKQAEELRKRSPLGHIASMKTPVLLLHDENDHSSHPSQGQMLFTALKVRGVPTGLCILPEGNRSLASKRTPLARDRYHTEILR